MGNAMASTMQGLLRQTQKSTTGLVQSTAFAQLARGMLRNHTEFLTEAGQSGMALLAQGQAEMTRRV